MKEKFIALSKKVAMDIPFISPYWYFDKLFILFVKTAIAIFGEGGGNNALLVIFFPGLFASLITTMLIYLVAISIVFKILF